MADFCIFKECLILLLGSFVNFFNYSISNQFRLNLQKIKPLNILTEIRLICVTLCLLEFYSLNVDLISSMSCFKTFENLNFVGILIVSVNWKFLFNEFVLNFKNAVFSHRLFEFLAHKIIRTHFIHKTFI